jgi:hypothetical protein
MTQLGIKNACRWLDWSEDKVRKAFSEVVASGLIVAPDDRQLPAMSGNDRQLPGNDLLRIEENREEKRREEENVAPSVSAKPLAAAPADLDEIGHILSDRKVTVTLQHSWLEAFPDPLWIIAEIRKALAWEAANPARKKRNFGAFMTRWMSKGWDQRKGLVAITQVQTKTPEELELEAYVKRMRETKLTDFGDVP